MITLAIDQVQKLVRELSGHVSDMERLLRSQVFEALELQKFMCRQVLKAYIVHEMQISRISFELYLVFAHVSKSHLIVTRMIYHDLCQIDAVDDLSNTCCG